MLRDFDLGDAAREGLFTGFLGVDFIEWRSVSDRLSFDFYELLVNYVKQQFIIIRFIKIVIF